MNFPRISSRIIPLRTVIFLLISILVYLYGVFYVYDYTIDDAYISLRYAENLAEYGQLSYNPGDLPSEGYTNFLLVLIEALFLKLGFTNVINVPKLIGIIFGIITICYVYLMARALNEDGREIFNYIPAFATAVSTPFIMWSSAGLETTFFSGLLIIGVYHYLRFLETDTLKNGLISEGFFLLSALCRPEGVLIWFLTYLFSLIYYKQYPLINKLKAGGIFVFLLGIYLAWKYYYFGNVLPLTFYAKSFNYGLATMVDGFKRSLFFLQINISFIYAALFLISILYSIVKKNFRLRFLNLIIIVFYLYVIRLGYEVAMDDCFRLYVPFIPLFYISSSTGFTYLSESFKHLSTKFISVALTGFLVLQIAIGAYDLNTAWQKDYNFGAKAGSDNGKGLVSIMDQWDKCWRAMAFLLKQYAPPGSTIVAADIGMLGYYSKLNVIDTWSLVNKDIVMLQKELPNYTPGSPEHENIKQEIRNYIFEQNPEILIQDPVADTFMDSRILNYSPLKISFYFYNNELKLFVRKDLLTKPTAKN